MGSFHRFVLAISPLICLLCNPPRSAAADAAKEFNVTNYGAVADGHTPCTDAIRQAIDACSTAGGSVVIPAGNYLTGPIHLKSNVNLHVDAGAVVLFSRDFADYPLSLTSLAGGEAVQCVSPISGDNLQNVSITGSGIFDGNGDAWRPVKKEKLNNAQWSALTASGGFVDAQTQTWYPSQTWITGQKALQELRNANSITLTDFAPYRNLIRPALVLLQNCHHLLLDGPTFRNSPGWNIHLFASDDITVRNLTVFNPAYAQNGDGIDIDSCHDVSVADSHVDAGDDAICLKSGRDEPGRRFNHPTENVTITNCTIGTGHGGITIGSEMSGGVRNIHVSHCVLRGTGGGLRFKTTRGRGGVVEDIHISDIQMFDIQQEAIGLDMYYGVKNPTTQPVSEATPCFRNIQIQNIQCEGAAVALNLRGLPEMPLEGITISDSQITANKAGQIIDAKNITLHNVKIVSKVGDTVRVQNTQGLVNDP
jgi:polygalacturonase